MLYDLHEIRRSFLRPFSAFTDMSSVMFSHPYSPLSHTPLSRQIAASYELMHRLGKDYEKPAWGLPNTVIDGQTVAVTERLAAQRPFCRLVHFERQGSQERRPDPRILLVAPRSGHHATLLRATVEALLPNHEVYVTDWTDARMVPLEDGTFHLNEYVTYVQDFIRLLGPDVHAMAVCQRTVPVLAAISLMAAAGETCTPRSMILMGGPVDARKSPTQVNRLATTKPYSWFETNIIEKVPTRYAA